MSAGRHAQSWYRSSPRSGLIEFPPIDRSIHLPPQHLFEQVSDEIFYLPTLSNTTAGRQSVLDYLMASRRTVLVVNRNTEAGYVAFERWTAPAVDVASPLVGATGASGQRNLRLMDILHLVEHDDANPAAPAPAPRGGTQPGGWEARSHPLHTRIHRRLVVSEHLKRLLAERFRLRDAERDRFVVLPPPVDPAQFTEDAVRAAHAASTAHRERPTVMFLGRLDEQKDPLLWLSAACLVQRDVPDVQFRILGSGPLRGAMEHVLWLAEQRRMGSGGNQPAAAAVPLPGATEAPKEAAYPDHVVRTVINSACDIGAFRIEGEVAHHDTAARLAEASLLLMSSRFEGTPMVILEALCLGVPVVAPAVGSIPALLQGGGGTSVTSRGHGALELARELARRVVERLREGPPSLEQRLARRADCLARFGLPRFQDQLGAQVRELVASVDRQQRQAELEAAQAAQYVRLLEGAPLA